MLLDNSKSRGRENVINRVVKSNLHFVVAAGNDNRDTCDCSLAAAMYYHKERATNQHHINQSNEETNNHIRHKNILLLFFEGFLKSTDCHYSRYAPGDINLLACTCTIYLDGKVKSLVNNILASRGLHVRFRLCFANFDATSVEQHKIGSHLLSSILDWHHDCS